MTFEQVVDKFINHPVYMQSGAGKMAKRFKTTKNIIKKAKAFVRNKDKNFPKILLFDIETSPSISYTWRRFKENIAYDHVEQEPIMLTWSAKWLYSTTIMSDAITSDEVKRVDDYRIVKSLWDLIDEADIVIAHYGDYFDIPFLNYRALLNNLPPFSSTKSIDTKRIASKHFKFPSNKLDAIASYLGFNGKLPTSMALWIDCVKGDVKAIRKMELYNIQDVRILEDVYIKLRPYIKSHPNLALYMEKEESVCSTCGSNKVTETGKYYYTNAGKYKEYRCECGALTRGRKNQYPKDKKTNLLISTAR